MRLSRNKGPAGIHDRLAGVFRSQFPAPMAKGRRGGFRVRSVTEFFHRPRTMRRQPSSTTLLRLIRHTSRRCSGSTRGDRMRSAFRPTRQSLDRTLPRPIRCSVYCRAGRHLFRTCTVRRRAMSQRRTRPVRIEYSSFLTQVTTPPNPVPRRSRSSTPPHGAPAPAVRRRQSRPSAARCQRQPNGQNWSRARLQGCNRIRLDGLSS